MENDNQPDNSHQLARRSLLTHGAALAGGAASAVLLSQTAAAAATQPDATTIVSTLTGAAIQAAIDALPSTGGVVELVAGTYAMTTSLLIRSTCQLVGAGRGVSVLRLSGGANNTVVRNVDTTNGNAKITLRSLTIDGNKAQQSGALTHHGIEFHKCADLVLDDIEAAQCDGIGILLSGDGIVTRVSQVNNVYAHDNALHGMWVTWAMRETTYNTVTCDLNGQDGLVIDHSEAIATGIHCSRNGRDGVRITNVVDDNLVGITADLNGRTGIRVMGFVNSIGASWSAHNNGQTQPGADIHFDATINTYGLTNHATVSGIECGALQKSTWGTPWPGTPKPTETYGLIVDAAIQGNLTLLGVRNTGGKSGAYSLAPIGSTGSLSILDQPVGTADFRLLRGNLHVAGGNIVHDSNGKLGFYGNAAVARPTVTGHKTPNEPIAISLLAALVALGLVTDATT